jgi:large subunit ribosomal protein L15
MRDLIKRLPKLRGHGVNRAATVNNEKVKPTVVNLGTLETTFAAGETVSPATLVAKRVVSQLRKRNPEVKILGTGSLTKALTVSGCLLSATAKAAIVKAGGRVE